MNPNNSSLSQPPSGIHARDVPPPPYSETDIYSNSAPSPRTANDDGPASRLSSSPAGDVVFTPPETPRTSASNLPAAPSNSRSSYLDSRPPPPFAAPDLILHTVDVRAASRAVDFAYPSAWAARDVSSHDWATFINLLMSDHAKPGADVPVNDASTAPGRSKTDGRLHQLPESVPENIRRRADADATVQEWNIAFFTPRGIHILLAPFPAPERMPGSWDPVMDAHVPPPRPLDPPGPPPFPQLPPRAPPPRTRTWGGLTIGDDGIRYGNRFVADSSGLRIGSLVMDNSGIRFNGQGSDPALGTYGPPPGFVPPVPPMAPFPGPAFEPQPIHRRQYHHVGGWEHDEKHAHGSSEERGRRRRSEPNAGVKRSESVSSTSSSSSGSSSSSESSIGSLPDYKDIRDEQLPLYVERLQDWTAHPDQPRSRGDIKKLKADLQGAKHSQVALSQDRKALRVEMKALSQQWRQLKKQQKSVRKAARRERRQRRRAEKRERRQDRREARRARRDVRRGRTGSGAPPLVPGVMAGPTHWGGRGGCGPGWGRGGFGGPPHGGFIGGLHGQFGPNGFGGPPGPRGPFAGGGPHGRGGLWGRPGEGFFGQGGGMPWEGNARAAPGAWPDDVKSRGGQETGTTVPPPGATSAAKYRAAEDIEAQIRTIAKQSKELEGRGSAPALDKQMETLTKQLERIRMEADEAYARELAEQ